MRLKTDLNRLSDYFEKQSEYALLSGCFAAILVIGYLDYALPYQVSMSVFYTIPIMFAAWYADKKSADLIAIISLIITWWTDELTMPPEDLGWIHTYRMIVRLFFFLFFSMGMAAMRARRDLVLARLELDRKQIELLERSRRLELEIIRISEREQCRIGRDLHDGLCQYLAALSCAAASLKNDLAKLSLRDETRSAADLAELLKQGVTQARNLARGLSPVHDDESGLDSALHELADCSSRLLDIECEFEPGARVFVHDHTTAAHLFRIAQEALNNATRHGGASHVVIGLCERDGLVTLSIADNGNGLPVDAEKSTGMGLKIMDYRARMIGGELHVADNPALGGVTVTCAFRQGPAIIESGEFFLEHVAHAEPEHALTA